MIAKDYHMGILCVIFSKQLVIHLAKIIILNVHGIPHALSLGFRLLEGKLLVELRESRLFFIIVKRVMISCVDLNIGENFLSSKSRQLFEYPLVKNVFHIAPT